jgi:hypothetical protein
MCRARLNSFNLTASTKKHQGHFEAQDKRLLQKYRFIFYAQSYLNAM